MANDETKRNSTSAINRAKQIKSWSRETAFRQVNICKVGVFGMVIKATPVVETGAKHFRPSILRYSTSP